MKRLVLALAFLLPFLLIPSAHAHTTYCGHGVHWGTSGGLHRAEWVRHWTEYVWMPPRHYHIVYLTPQWYSVRNQCPLH